MGKIMQQKANDEEKKEFGKIWQQRVEAIFLALDEVVTIEVIS
jgi:two-component sensor histidine kinase